MEDLQKLSETKQEPEKIKNLAEAASANISIGIDKFKTKFFYPTNRIAEALGATEENYHWLKREKELKEEIAAEEGELKKYYDRKDVVTGSTLNLAGSLIQSGVDPISLLTNAATSGAGIAAQAVMNAAEYMIEEKIIYDRNVTDIGIEDAPGLVAGIVLPKGMQVLENVKYKGGEALFDMKQVDLQGNTYKKPTVNEVMQELNARGIETPDTNATLTRIQEASSILDEISKAEDLETMRFLSDHLTDEYGELGNYVREKRIKAQWNEISKPEIKADIDKALDDHKIEADPLLMSQKEINTAVDNEFKKVESTKSKEWTKPKTIEYFSERGVIPEGEEIVKVKSATSGNYQRGKSGDSYYTYSGKTDTTFYIQTKDKDGNLKFREYYLNDDGTPIETYTYTPQRSSLDIVQQSLVGEKTGTADGSVFLKNQMADVIARDAYDGVQGNYGFRNGFETNFNTYIDLVRGIDRTMEMELAAKGRTNIAFEREMDILFKPIRTDIELSLKQLEMQDAQELFGATKNAKPFGNQLYDFTKQWDSFEFVESLQNTNDANEMDIRLRISEMRKSGNDIEADSLELKLNTMKLIKDKLNQFVSIKAEEGEIKDIGEAYYINTLYNKRQYMQNLTEAVRTGDIDFLMKMGTFVGESVEVTDEDVKSIIKSLSPMQKESKILVPGKYSIKDFPEELGILLRNDIESTTGAAKKGAYGEAAEISTIGKKWGNGGEYSNFASSFTGTENNPYEIVSRIYSTIAKYKLGLDKIEGYINDLSPGSQVGKDSKSRFIQVTSDRPTGRYIKAQLEKLGLSGMVEERYKPNFNIDPEDPKLANVVLRRATKNFMSFKFLTSLNGLKEEGMNKRLGVRGAAMLGWNMKYSKLKTAFYNPIEVESGFMKAINGIRKENLDSIKDPIIRARAEAFLTKYLANDPIFNDPSMWTLKDTGKESVLLKGSSKLLQGLHAVSKKGAWLQTASDAHRTFNAEWLSKNYVMDILPTMEKNATPILKQILDSNGIDDQRFFDLKNYIKTLSSEQIDEIVFSGKVAENETDHVIQQLFEQFADVLGRKFDPFESAKQGALGDGFVMDQWLLFKRFSMGALSKTYQSLSTYYSSDGHMRGRMSGVVEAMRTGEGLKGVKNVFEGSNRICLTNFAWTAAKFKLATMGIQHITGTVMGTSNDERVESEIDAMSRGEIVPSIIDSALEQFYNETGINIVFGSQSVMGSLYNKTVKRVNQASSAANLNPVEKIGYFMAATLSPEIVSKGIDEMKFQSNIGTRVYGPGELNQNLWAKKYRREALFQQQLGELPAEKLVKYLGGGVISLFSLGETDKKHEIIDDKTDYVDYYKKNPQKAHDLMGTDKRKVDDDVAVMGASGVMEMAKEITQAQAIGEIMGDKDLLPEQKEKELIALGLDVETQARRMKRSDFNTLTAILSYKGIREPLEILTVMQQFNSTSSAKRNEFFNEFFVDDNDFEMFQSFQSNLTYNEKKLNKKLAQRKNKVGMAGFVEVLDVLNGIE
ncbi:MAG: hypothetical protein ACRCZ2_06740 [Fusobacteriaceae bacterium]